jgi:hypothetical protein
MVLRIFLINGNSSISKNLFGSRDGVEPLKHKGYN